QTYTIRGQVTDSTANAVEMAQIAIKEDPRKVSFTNADGQFTLQLNAYNTPLTLVVTNLNYHACTLHVLPKDSVKQFTMNLAAVIVYVAEILMKILFTLMILKFLDPN
ncbi:MAG: carboxypeptidase-like regulatory domain-containing protein, partial [Bacteroidia bacterium]